ncbi:MAG: cupredoxin domain-containing protein [Armatimonadota bacterium]|nr:cupredoxin domain-containing protein [Armatimonadota bacterium]MDR7520376.1 cupredoxin domain-containing protein [Armatimonadota bacterium]MDR7550009.1 cupredoxin domain-containing protein [Armatimonadota bacterium]
MPSRWMPAAIFVLGLVLAVAATATTAPKPQAVEVTAGTPRNEFEFVPKEITVAVGQPVQLTLVNKGKVEHDLHIEALGVAVPPKGKDPAANVLATGKSATATFTPARKGRFEFWCTVPGHKEVGMKGVLIVK